MKREGGEERAPLLVKVSDGGGSSDGGGLPWRVWEESKKLWQIVGPAIFSGLAVDSMNIITRAFAGHLGNLQLASISIANTVVVGFSFGIMLGMSSALDTLCGQAFGARKYHMLGVYMQRSLIVLFLCAMLLTPLYFFATPVLLWTGQPAEMAAQAGQVSVWLVPLHFSYVFLVPLQRFLQCQLKNSVGAAVSGAILVVHLIISWTFVYHLRLGLFGTAMTLNVSWWLSAAVTFGYVACGGCPESWKAFSVEAFSGLWEFIKLSAASGVMQCLESWYRMILVVLTGKLKDAELAVVALSICMSINSWVQMIPLAFFGGTVVRVGNELGAGNGKGARFATIVSLSTSLVIGFFFWALIMVFHGRFALIFTSNIVVLDAIDKLSTLLAFNILLNSVQQILSGVAVGSGWQSMVAYVNVGSYYIIGVPVGILLGWTFQFGVLGIWAGMIGGTAIQTLILAFITIRCNWEKEAMEASKRMEKWSTSN